VPRGIDASSGLEHGATALRVPQRGELGEVTATAVAIGDHLEHPDARRAKEAEQVVLVEHAAKTNEWLAANPGARLPFDIDHVRRIAYDTPTQLRKRLETEIRTVFERRGYVTR
jgi:hypothetical protein